MGGGHLQQKQFQQVQFSQIMALNLSILQMTRPALAVAVSQISSHNPMIDSSEEFLPWKPHFQKALPDFLEENLTQEKTLFEQLREEFILELEKDDYPFLYLLIGNLSTNGFLLYPLKKICQGLVVDLERMEYIRTLMLNSSYLGLGALNSREYLLFMVQHFYGENSVEYRITEMLPQNSSKIIKIKDFTKKLSLDDSLVEKALQNIKKIVASPLTGEKVKPVYPDFVISIQDQELTIQATVLTTPEIRIKNCDFSQWTKQEIRAFLKEAQQLQTALEKRKSSLQKHAEALILARSDFFLGTTPTHVQIQLKDIAEITGRHVSTVSRSLKDRYFFFNNKIYPFSVLWTHRVGNTDSYTIKKTIRQLIEHESPNTPFSDNEITAILHKKGFPIARRTVNKYRKELEISSSYRRS